MHDHSVIPRLGEASRAPSWWAGASPELAAFEMHASEGCSVCARALVNGRETAVDLASTAPRVRPSATARAALLDRVRGLRAAPPQAPQAKARVFDPSATVAHAHVADPADAARIAEIDALRASEPRPGEGSSRMLAQLARFLDFSIFFVSIVRGERVTYRVQRGLPESLGAFRELRREMSFCTHCVSGAAPLLVENALVEPFFRGNKAATRFGVAAYVGAPLRTSRDIVIGTLCALDFTPRALPAVTSQVLEVFARRAVAEIEGERSPELLPAVIERASDRADLHAAPFFRDLVAAELATGASSARLAHATHATASPLRAPRGASALVTLRVPERAAEAAAATLLDLLDEHETAGRIDATTFGLLLPGAGAELAAARLSRLRASAPDGSLGLALAPTGPSTADDWIASSLR